MAEQQRPQPQQIMIPMETVRAICALVALFPAASVEDVVAEFGLPSDQATLMLALARAVVRDLEREDRAEAEAAADDTPDA